MSLNLLSFHYFNSLPAWVNRIQQVILGFSFVLFLYLTVYSIQYIGIGLIGTIMLGIGAHILVPIFFIIALYKLARYNPGYGWIVGGAVATILYATAFVVDWQHRVDKFDRLSNSSVLATGTEQLPVWVRLAQSIHNDWVTDRILKVGLVYHSSDRALNWFDVPSRRWGEEMIHDPLVEIASAFGVSHVPEPDRINILKALSLRHHGESRLWSGRHLATTYVVNDIDVFAASRISYTEQYLNIRNSSESTWRTEEAIYTFYLPEGAVVTSLSLWIDGIEQKGYLTSKQKAREAYNTIVGREQRDPSVVHWQEGNTVTVRVFPCTSREERKFKIGVTSPMQEKDGKLVYKSIRFDGPSASNANETIRVRIHDLDALPSLIGFRSDEAGGQITELKYDPDFEFGFDTPALAADRSFWFDGNRYSISESKPDYQPVDFKSIYLDVNNSWTLDEVQDAIDAAGNRGVYAFNGVTFTKVENEFAPVLKELIEYNFSIFPFHRIPDPAASLVITKGEPMSPHLDDFKESEFGTAVNAFFAHPRKIFVYNLGGSLSTYVRSLREFRALHFTSGNTEQLALLLGGHKFPIYAEDESQVVLHDAHLALRKIPDDEKGINTAPDHLARLFAYNNILRQAGPVYFSDDYINETLISQASMANIVSPVSSLIVLESKADYERFGIEANPDGLQNATKDSSGAVPEPHEWALLVLFCLLVLYMTFQSRLKNLISR